MIVIAKLNGQLVQIVKTAEQVAFSKETGWVLICTDWQQLERKRQSFKWIPASTQFCWVREFNSEANPQYD